MKKPSPVRSSPLRAVSTTTLAHVGGGEEKKPPPPRPSPTPPPPPPPPSDYVKITLEDILVSTY